MMYRVSPHLSAVEVRAPVRTFDDVFRHLWLADLKADQGGDRLVEMVVSDGRLRFGVERGGRRG